mgnify:CR=1 FL=1
MMNIVGEIKELFLRSLKDHPEVLEKMEKEDPDEKTRAIVRMLLNEIHNDPEYSGVSHKEICITRNTTESMNIIIQGIKLNDGDEILRTNLEYPNMIQALDMREQRFGTKIQIVDLPIHPESQEQIVQLIMNAINNKLLNEDAIFETLSSLKRAGASAIVTYFADRVASRLG